MATVGLNLRPEKRETRLCKFLETFSREKIEADVTQNMYIQTNMLFLKTMKPCFVSSLP